MKDSQPNSLEQLRKTAKSCRNCALWANATQTVFGTGNPHAEVMLVGEQPGDQEDLKGLPFVGPAGQLLDRALIAAGVDRETVYITNAVKHFKWELRGNRRLHKTPAQREVDACRPWLEGEINAVKPRVIVCLGATAAHALLGKDFKVSTQRGHFIKSDFAEFVFATLHPSAILRIRESEQREIAFQSLIQDLSLIRQTLHRERPAA
ncbi:MAG: UdgX family uracil-DNA binding protein [Pseudomonadota bacterium]